MISLQGSSALVVFSFLSVFATADPLNIYCDACGGPNQLTDYGNFAINQVYGPESWVPYHLQGELIISNSEGFQMHVDLNHVLSTSIITDLLNFFLPEEIEIGFPIAIQATVTSSNAASTEYSVSYTALDSFGPLGVGSAGSEDGGSSGGGVGSGGGTLIGNGGTQACTSADSIEWDCRIVPE